MSERVYVVATPENLLVRFDRAGLATRTTALCLDLLVMAALMQIAFALVVPLHLVSEGVAAALWIVGAFLVQWWYGAFCEWRFGRTLGKRLCGLRVVDASGLKLAFFPAVIRNLLRLADMLPLLHLTGAVCCLLDPHGRRLGDLAAQSVVVRDAAGRTRRVVRDDGHLHRQTFASEAVLKALQPLERRAIRRLCAVREMLPLADRVQLCDQLTQHLLRCHRFDVPGHLSSERILLTLDEALRAGGIDEDG